MSKTFAAFLAVGMFGLLSAETPADPVVPEGYTVELYASGIGAATALALGPDGSLYITDYASGQLLKRTPAGSLQVVTSGLPDSNALAVLPSGRIFAGAKYLCRTQACRASRSSSVRRSSGWSARYT